MRDRDISLLGISEHCLPMARSTVRDKLHQAFHRHDFNHLTYRFDSSSEKVEGKLYGGSGMIAADRFASTLDTGAKFGDSMGRWTGMTFRRRHQRPLTIISIYQACKEPTNAFGDTAWHQQRRELDSQGRHDIHPRTAFSDDLVSWVKKLQQQHHSVILGGDWNAVLHESNSVVRRLIDQCNLLDPWAHFHPDDLAFATHDRSANRRIDSIVMSQDLLPSVDSVSYSPVGELFDSDHRAVCLTLKTSSLFGNDDPMFTPFLARGVRSKDTTAVQNFVETMYSHLAEHGAFARSAKLVEDDHSQLDLVEEMDALLGEAGKLGEKACRRRRAPWYNTPLVKLRLKRQALWFYLRGLRKKINRANLLLSRSSVANLGINFPDTIEETLALLVQVSEELREAISKAQTTRQHELNAKADRYDIAHERGRARAVRAMNKTEAAGRAYATFARMANDSTQRLDRIEIPADWPAPHEEVQTLSDPKTCTEWREVSNPTEVEYYLMLRNRLHFGQAQGTPFTEPPLSNEFDWEATTPQADEVLAGTYENSSVTPDTALVLQQCKSICDLDSVPCELTDEDFCGKLKKWRETTSTSPSGRHLGWYKSLVVNGPYPPGSEAAADFEAKQFAIRTVILRVMNHCIRHGYSLQRWRTIVNTMIFKDVGVYKIHRLRVIHIYEADFNLLLGVKWRQLMWSAEKQDQFHVGQFGGRPGLEASTLALMEELRIDISYLTRRVLIHFDADAASCYDRIIPLLASLINRHAGLHRHVVVVHAATLRQARYKLRTSLGVSDLEYTHCHTFPLYGTGQGAGNSPCIWLFISSTLFKAHATQAYGARFESPDGTVSTDVTLVGFVDDTNAASNTWHPQHDEPFEEIVRRMLHDAQAWTNLLHVSGGKLEIDKSSFHVLRFTFKKDGTAIPEHLPPRNVTFELQDPASGNRMPVKCMFTSQPHKTLGHWKSPIQRPSPYQLKALQHKADKISRQIAGSPVTRYGAYLGYTSKFLPAIKYPLPQSFFTAAQLERAEQPSRARLISKCGYNSKTSHAIIFLPPDLAGAGFVHWHTLQGEGQITNFLKHWRSDTSTTDLLRIDLAWSQYFTGRGVPLLEHPGSTVPTLPNRWLSSLRATLHQFDCILQVDTPFIHPLERVGDQHIMDYVQEHDLFPIQRDLDLFNLCRLYMQAWTLLCDNKQVIDWLNTRQEYRHVYANSTLKADYDVLEATHQILQRLALPKHTFEWERGHQDRNGNASKLSVRASFNVLADEIADYYMSKKDSRLRLRTHLLPGTKCLLHIDGKTIHSHYLAHIRRAASKKDFHLHLQRNFDWSQEIIDQMYWPAFQRAARTYFSSDVHLMKLVYEQLPTKFILHRHMKDTSLQCCSHCSRPETLQHLICDACSPASTAFQKAIRQNVSNYMAKVNAPATFRSLVTSGIQIALGLPQDDSELYELWGPFTDLFRQQSEIGWYHFLRGFLSSHWHSCLRSLSPTTTDVTVSESSDGFHDSMFSSDDDTIDSHPTPSTNANFFDWEISIDMNFIEPPVTPRQFDPLTVLSGLIKTMWTDISALWHHRCELVHGQSGDSPLSLSVMRSKLTDLYTLRDQVLPADREYLFRDDIEEFLKTASLFQLRRHYTTVQPRIIASMKKYKSVPKSQTRMTQFFTNLGNRLARTAAAARNHLRSRLQNTATNEPDHRKRNRRRLPTTGSSESPTIPSHFPSPSPSPHAP